MKNNNFDLNKKIQKLPISQEDIDKLKNNSKHRSGIWEIDWGVEPFSKARGYNGEDLILVIVVHKESYYILDTRAYPKSEDNKGVKTFINATNKELTLPETVMVRDKTLADELMLLASALEFKIVISPLKAIPQIRKDMRRMLG